MLIKLDIKDISSIVFLLSSFSSRKISDLSSLDEVFISVNLEGKKSIVEGKDLLFDFLDYSSPFEMPFSIIKDNKDIYNDVLKLSSLEALYILYSASILRLAMNLVTPNHMYDSILNFLAYRENLSYSNAQSLLIVIKSLTGFNYFGVKKYPFSRIITPVKISNPCDIGESTSLGVLDHAVLSYTKKSQSMLRDKNKTILIQLNPSDINILKLHHFITGSTNAVYEVYTPETYASNFHSLRLSLSKRGGVVNLAFHLAKGVCEEIFMNHLKSIGVLKMEVELEDGYLANATMIEDSPLSSHKAIYSIWIKDSKSSPYIRSSDINVELDFIPVVSKISMVSVAKNQIN